MRKVIAAINMTLDGYCDHTAIIPDDEIHWHYTDLLKKGDVILYGRKTYLLMLYWQEVVKNPTGNKAIDEFAIVMDNIPKIVFSNTLKNDDPEISNWKSAAHASQSIEKVVLELKPQSGKDILIGSRSLILQLMKLNLIDEYQFCIHPVIAGSGLPLFDNFDYRTLLKLIKTKHFKGGAVSLYYEPNH